MSIQLAVGGRSIVVQPGSLDVRMSATLEAELEALLGGRRWRMIEASSPNGRHRVA